MEELLQCCWLSLLCSRGSNLSLPLCARKVLPAWSRTGILIENTAVPSITLSDAWEAFLSMGEEQQEADLEENSSLQHLNIS